MGVCPGLANFTRERPRTGVNTVPSTTPGTASLNWFLPANYAATFYRQVMSPEVSQTAGTNTWVPVNYTTVNVEANDVYVPASTGNPTEDTFSGYAAYQAALGTNTEVDYDYTPSVPSSGDPNQPTVPAAGDTVSTVTWKVEPANSTNRIAGSYGLSVWIPQGPTESLTATQQTFQAQYEVFTITDSAGNTYTDVVNVYNGGSGWIPLGNGGAPTNRTFAYDGVNPILVTLYNTVPANTLGQLEDVVGNFVYADAVEAVPLTGSYTASPIISQFTTTGASPTVVTNVVSALNHTSNVPGLGGSFKLGSGDTGNGTCSPISVSPSASVGVYTFTFTSATTASGTGPGGAALPGLTVGTPYSAAGIEFTITAGSTAFVSGDTFTINVSGSATSSSLTQGVVMSSTFNTGGNRWTWSPSEVAASTQVLDYGNAAVTAAPPWAQTTVNGTKGTSCYTASTVGSLASASAVTYAPTSNLKDGSYPIYMWIPGNSGTFSFDQYETVQIFEGTTVTTVTVDCSTSSGWVQLGTRAFSQNNAAGEPLKVEVLNYSAAAPTARAPHLRTRLSSWDPITSRSTPLRFKRLAWSVRREVARRSPLLLPW